MGPMKQHLTLAVAFATALMACGSSSSDGGGGEGGTKKVDVGIEAACQDACANVGPSDCTKCTSVCSDPHCAGVFSESNFMLTTEIVCSSQVINFIDDNAGETYACTIP